MASPTPTPPAPFAPLPAPAIPGRQGVYGHSVVALLVILGAAFVIEWLWVVPNSGAEADAAVYLLTGRNLATRGDPGHLSPDPLVFVPEHMVEARPGVFYPIYPIGYSALCAVAYAIGGPLAAFYVNPILLLAGLVGVFLLARTFLDDLLALGATAFLALHPALLYYGSIAMSHAAEFALSTWCLYCLCAWDRKPRAWVLAAAGALVSASISVRYTGALLALPFAYVVLLQVWRSRATPPGSGEALSLKRLFAQVALAGGVALLAIAPLLVYHERAFGSPFTTGYSLSGEASAFSFTHFREHAPYALKALWQMPLGLTILFPLAVGGIAWLLRRQPRLGVLFVLCTLPTWLLYASYYWYIRDATPWWQPVSTDSLLYVRFFLGMFPMLVIAALLLVERLIDLRPQTPASRTTLRAGVSAVLLLLGIFNMTLFPRWTKFLGSAETDRLVMELVRKVVPNDAVIVADGFTVHSMVYQTDMTVYYPRYFASKWLEERLQPATATRPATFDPLRRERLAAEVAGRSSDELLAVLRGRLVGHARKGQTVWLATRTTSPRWYPPLEDVFTFRPMAADPEYGLMLFQLTLKETAPGVGAR